MCFLKISSNIPGKKNPVLVLRDLMISTRRLLFQRTQKSEFGREQFKGNSRDAYIDPLDYQMLMQDSDQVCLYFN